MQIYNEEDRLLNERGNDVFCQVVFLLHVGRLRQQCYSLVKTFACSIVPLEHENLYNTTFCDYSRILISKVV